MPTGASASQPGDLILVVDIGGGTTDFTLIAVTESNGELALERVAVGEHILLGGDNIDLALAGAVAAAPGGKGHAHRQPAACRRCGTTAAWPRKSCWSPAVTAKEQPVTILGKGSGLVGGTIKATLLRSDIDSVLGEGFLPAVASTRDAGARSAAWACRNSGCPMPPTPRSRATWRASCGSRRPASRSRCARCGAGRAGWPAPRTCCSTAAC